jgi:hypothetical protein
LSSLDDEDEKELGVSPSFITPPIGETDEELLPQMYVKVE